MRRPPILTTVLLAAAGGMLFCGSASAQNAGAPASEARGLRYLSWASRTEAAPSAVAAPADAPAVRRGLRRPNTVIPHGGFAPSAPPPPARPGLTPAPGARRTLTPANAWMQPGAPPPEPAIPEPMMAVAPRPAPAPAPAAQPRATPDYLPAPGGRGQPVPAEVIHAPTPAPSPAPAGAEPLDPMAPRRDAPIFRLQQEASSAPPAVVPTAAPAVQPAAGSPEAAPRPRLVAEVSSSGERPPQQGGRYYSVHRQNGRQPDALEMPAPTYVDALVVTMPETIASQDLAAPEPGPTLIRDNQGRMRRAPAASDGDHQ
ncbi:MAG: hypothetical protein Q8J71_01610 [Brevundimonas sp.]|nr:hypothetical protein [Brevundimonas sp.]